MHKHTGFYFAALFSCSLLLLGGCGPKRVAPYSGGANPGADETSNTRMGNISEEMAPMVEGLDSTGQAGGGSFADGADQQSDAYKREHGRCSAEFKPIYFDYDQSTIKGDQIPTMEFNGNYLRNTPDARVLVEGNTDDRGTNEYNLALGERRAASAKKYLIQYGIAENRIRTVSYGEERPLFTGTNEDDYAYNRRDDFILE